MHVANRTSVQNDKHILEELYQRKREEQQQASCIDRLERDGEQAAALQLVRGDGEQQQPNKVLDRESRRLAAALQHKRRPAKNEKN
jgi:hypothetical protein